LIFNASIRAPLSLNAFRSGRVAGRNAARGGHGRASVISPLVHAAAIGLGNLEIAHTGWNQSESLKLGKDVVTASIQSRTASAMAANSPVHITLVAERSSRRIVGGQIVGGPTSASRVNVLTAVLRAKGTVEDLYNIDYVYAPALAPAHDPLFVAARMLQKSF
jgi:CoA-dependent NAD(P)H sulfur oxidoreductase